jgi:hypothetical protein
VTRGTVPQKTDRRTRALLAGCATGKGETVV